MTNKVCAFLVKTMYAVLFMFSVIMMFMSINAVLNPSLHFFQLDMNFAVQSAFILVLFIGILFVIFNLTNAQREENILSHSKDLTLIFLCAFCVRLCFLLFWGQHIDPVSDFGMAHATALGSEAHLQQYELFPSWGFYTIVLGRFYSLLIPTHITGQLINAAAASLTAVLVYLLADRIYSNRKISIPAALLFAFYPSNILYISILTPEHLAAFISFIIVLLLTKNQKSYKKHMVIMAVSGALLALMDNLRPMALVLLTAFFITAFFDFFINNTSVERKKIGVSIFVSVGIFIFVYMVSNYAFIRYIENRLNITIADSSSTRAHFLYIGLQPSGEGQIHLGNNPRMFHHFLHQTGRDFQLAGDLTSEFLLERIRESPEQFARLFPQKFHWAWRDDTVPSWYVFDRIRQDPSNHDSRLLYIAENVFPSVSQIFYVFIIALSSLGLWKSIRGRFNYPHFLVSLYWLGFILLLLIGEAQSRYKSVIIPFICILAAYGLCVLFTKGRRDNGFNLFTTCNS